MDLQEIQSEMSKFVQEKGWDRSESTKPQTPRNLVISLSLEAAELLECFQWSEEADTAAVADELADVILYAAQIANILCLDLNKIVREKAESNFQRNWIAARPLKRE